MPDRSMCIAIPHADWMPERVKSLDRLMRQITPYQGDYVPLRIITGKVMPWVWARHLWQAQLDTGAEYCIALADDSVVDRSFISSVRSMSYSVPDRCVLGLAAQHPRAPEVAKVSPWYRTRSWAVGWGYAMRRDTLIVFLDWFDAKSYAWKEAHSDDNSINEWVSETGRDTWHPLPSPVDHDTSLASTWLPEPDTTNRSSWSWNNEGRMPPPNWWSFWKEPPFLEMPSEEIKKGLGENYWR